MKTYVLKFMTVCMVAGMLSCRKDIPIHYGPGCYQFERVDISLLTTFNNDGIQYRSPYFNPNNSNEFVYHYRDNISKKQTLIKYNLETGIKTELAQNVGVINQPSWSRKGWIAFDNDHQIWIVKQNGDSLRQLTTNRGNLYPAWDSTGDNLYWQYSSNGGFPYYVLKQNMNTLTIDTISNSIDNDSGYYLRFPEFSKSNRLIARTSISNRPYIGVATTSFDFSGLVADSYVIGGLSGLTWKDDNTAYFSVYHFGLYDLNTQNGEYHKIINFCDSKAYKTISCSADGKKLIGERVDRYQIRDNEGNATGQIMENSSIYLIDLETLEETKINLD